LTEQDKINRGQSAAAILDSALFNEVIATLDKKYVQEWRNAQTPDLREDLHRRVILLFEIVKDIRDIAVNGVMTEAREAELRGEEYVPPRKSWLSSLKEIV